jgi:hypothetical protein
MGSVPRINRLLTTVFIPNALLHLLEE